jgi:hypothetical protein
MPMPSYRARRSLWFFPVLLLSFACRAPAETDLTPNQPPSSAPLLPLRIGSIGPDFARAVATDAAGNSYVDGYFSGSVDFDAGSGATVRSAIGLYDIAVASYASDGSFRWVSVIGGTGADVPYAIKLAPDGALYVTGYITAGAICNGHVLRNAGGSDVLLMRISAAGTCDWAITMGGTGDDEGHDLVVDANGDVLVTGSFSGTASFRPDSGAALLISRGGTDGFVARYGADGTFKSVVQFGGTGDDAGNAIALRTDGDFVIGGVFSGTATFGSTLAPLLLASQGGLDYFVARLAPTLGLEWAIRGGGPGNDQVNSGGIIAGTDGLIYVAGTFTGTANIGGAVAVSHGDADVFLAAFDGTGTWVGFTRTFGGPGTDGVSAFARDASGNLYLAGYFQGTVDFDPGAGVHLVAGLGTGGAADGYVLSLTPAGDFRWVVPISALIAGDMNFCIASGISLASDGTIWTVGRFFGVVDFALGGTAVIRQSVGDADQFVVRYDQATGAIRR